MGSGSGMASGQRSRERGGKEGGQGVRGPNAPALEHAGEKAGSANAIASARLAMQSLNTDSQCRLVMHLPLFKLGISQRGVKRRSASESAVFGGWLDGLTIMRIGSGWEGHTRGWEGG